MPTKSDIQLGEGTIYFNGLSARVTEISETEMTAKGDYIEKDFKVIKLPLSADVTFECAMKIPLKWKLLWKWHIFKAKLFIYGERRKILKHIEKLYKLERKLKNENS